MIAFIALVLAVLSAFLVTGLFLYAFIVSLQQKPTLPFVQHVRALIEKRRAPLLSRAEKNPILRPSSHAWEAGAVMNPAAIHLHDRTHLFYRAVGTDGVSRIGYASSKDGVQFDERLPYPVYALPNNFSISESSLHREYLASRPDLLASGGSWSGIEDPRAVVIDDRMYLSFSAFHSWDSLRIGVTSLSLADLEAKRWNWSPPVFLSAPNEVHKNWVLFPEKIHGKFAILHAFRDGTRRRAVVNYLDTLDSEPSQYVKSDASFRGNVEPSLWDSRVRGSGPPPLKTDAGWLVFYHANDAREPEKYKLGALLLDAKDPSKIIARTPNAILEPETTYENEGKPGIVYACGATAIGDQLTVYYGGADNVVCAAATSLSHFTESLRSFRAPVLSLLPLRI
ncbi:MAG: hypothetical protein WAV21_01130 [Minisyncoccia bacterium]